MYRSFAISLLLLALLGCSKQREDSPAQSLVRTIHVLNEGEANTLAKTARVRCTDSDNCPSSVGMLTAQQGADIFTCTAFLVGEDLAATNSHCIPSAVKLMPDLCAERVKLELPSSGEFQTESISCKTLLTVSERPNDFSPDLALIRLSKSTKRIPFAMNKQGVIPGESYTAYKVNPVRGQPNKPSGEIMKDTCEAVGNSYAFPLYRNESDSIFVGGGCVSAPGNSGSPLLDKNGNAVGLIQAALNLSEAQNNAWLPYLKPDEREFGKMVLGTSLRCLSPDGRIDPSCVPFHQEDIERPRLSDFLESAELQAETGKLLAPYLRQISDFSWERTILEKRSLDRIETLQPHCILNSGGTDPALSEATLPVFSVRMSFNRYLQPSAHATLLKEEHQQFRFSRFDLQRTGEAKVESSNGTSRAITACP
ncbi:MAG: serine protease [Bacteriovoracia bacterium]